MEVQFGNVCVLNGDLTYMNEEHGYRIEKVHGKWHVYGSDGKDWCAFDERERAEEVLECRIAKEVST